MDDRRQGRPLAAAFQLLAQAIAIGLRLWFGQRRGVPLRFSRPQDGAVRAVVQG